MVLDSKAMGWASEQQLDTAALKKAKVPIYGKWYFPDLPPGVPLVNLHTGEVETFEAGFRAGAVLYVKEEDLKRAKLGPHAAVAAPAPPAEAPAAPAEAAAEAEAEPEAAPASAAPATATAPAGAGPTTERPEGTADDAQVREPAEPSASPTQPAVDEQEPVRMLHDDAERLPAGRMATSHPAHEQAVHEAAAHEVAPGDQEAIAREAHGAHLPPGEHAHPQSSVYIAVAAILAVITAIEVAVYYIPALFAFIIPILLVLSLVKFVMVVGYFMHLKFDHKLYTGFFVGGMAIALSVFVGMGLMFLGTPYGGGN